MRRRAGLPSAAGRSGRGRGTRGGTAATGRGLEKPGEKGKGRREGRGRREGGVGDVADGGVNGWR